MPAFLIPGAAPPVVFVSQMGTDGASWQPVLERLTSGATAFTYDRPGTGSAPPRTEPNTPLPYSAFAAELLRELEQADIFEPAVLVGHSIGSLIARTFAGAYPARVAGMVHVDGSIPRLVLEDMVEKRDGDGPDATVIDWRSGEVEALKARIPQAPTVVISRKPGWWSGEMPHPSLDDLWHTYQQILARDSSAPRVIATDAGHQVPREGPDLVAYVVDAVVDAVRASRAPHLDPIRLDTVGGWVDRVPLGAM
jgi:pimeloyl-ACP methyl ester carboxylesterase